MSFKHLVAQAWTIRNEDFQLLFTLFLLLVEHGIISVKTRFTLRLTRFRSHAYPLQLTLQSLAALACHLLFLLHALGLLLKP